MIEYLIESFFCLAIFYLNYVVFFRNSRNYHLNRIVLLFSLFFSLLIPTLSIPLNEFQLQSVTGNDDLIGIISISNNLLSSELINSTQTYGFINLITLLIIIYSSVTFILFGKFIYNIYILFLKGYRSEKIIYNHCKLTILDEKTNPFNFFNYIFISREFYKNGLIEESLILHESAHKKQMHSFDVVLIELIQVFFWFNPFIQIYKQLIKINHEYLADDFVLKSGVCNIEYSNKLLGFSIQKKTLNLTSSFNHILIKKRLIMLSKFKQKKPFAFQVVIFIPIAALLFFTTTFANTHIESGSKSGFFYADTLHWSSVNHNLYLRGDVILKYGENHYKGRGSFSSFGEVHLLIINNKTVPLNSVITISGIKHEVVQLSETEAFDKYGSKGKLGAIEIKAIK